MLRQFYGAAFLASAFRIIPRLGGIAVRRASRPEPFEEFDPRKTETRNVNATPGHILGAGGRADLFRLPRD